MYLTLQCIVQNFTLFEHPNQPEMTHFTFNNQSNDSDIQFKQKVR